LLSDTRTSLTSGLKGSCSDPTWRLVKAFLVGSFISRTHQWHFDDFELSGQHAEEIIAASCSCNTCIWKNITSLKEALREGAHDNEVDFAWNALLDAINIFVTSMRPLLIRCEINLPSLDQCIQLYLYQVNLRYCFGMLILLEALKNGARTDLLREVQFESQIVVATSFNVLKTGLEKNDSIDVLAQADKHNNGLRHSLTTTLIAIDPYPQHVVDMVLMLHKRLHRESSQHENTQHTYSQQLSILVVSLH
jgi:hypothetical protein